MLLYYCILFHPGSDIEKTVVEISFPEPGLAVFGSDAIQTRRVLFYGTEGRCQLNFQYQKHALTALIACCNVFDVSYPKPLPASGVLLFIQELLMGMHEQQVKNLLVIHH